MLDGRTISVVLDVLRPEREALIELLRGLDPADWARPTECPAYSVKGVATHVLGDDLSLLSRQRDEAENGLVLLAKEMPGAGFRTLLDAFNDRWVAAADFLSTDLVIELLRLAGEWTAAYYGEVDPESPGEPVGLFGARGATSPFWQAIAREYVERWVHHSQIRRALGLGSLADRRFLGPGLAVVATMAGADPDEPAEDGGAWRLGEVVLGPAGQAADLLTRRHSADEVRALVEGPEPAVARFAMAAGRPA
jgi:uncharacterized protein (TIGR03083 family)